MCLQELTLSRYFATTAEGPRTGVRPEPLVGGPTTTFAGDLARETGAYVHASLWEERPGESLGFNTAVVMAPDGNLAVRTRKLHIPLTAGYYEDHYFVGGPAGPMRSEPSKSTEPGSASPPVGTSGSPRWPGRTRWLARRYWSTRRPSGRSPVTPTSTLSRSGSE